MRILSTGTRVGMPTAGSDVPNSIIMICSVFDLIMTYP